MSSSQSASHAAGTFQKPPNGYRTFHPNQLPPDLNLQIESDLGVRLSQADRALGRLDGAIETLPDPDRFVSVKDVEKAIGASCETANGLVKRLEDLGILEEFTGKSRNRRYRYRSDIDLFAK